MENTPNQPLNLDALIRQKKAAIDRRITRTIANPFLLEQDRADVDSYAFLMKLTLESHNTLYLYFAEKFIELTDELMVPEDSIQTPQKTPGVPIIDNL